MGESMNYKTIYSAANATEAHLIKGLLGQKSIEVNLMGEDLSIGMGGLPTDVMQVKIKVNEDKYSEAMRIISNYEQLLKQPAQDGKSWECNECNKTNPDKFEICWSCQAIRMTVA